MIKIFAKDSKKILKNGSMKDKEKFIYCDNRECADTSCSRWIKHAPFETVLRVIRYKKEKDGTCKYKI